MLGETTSSLMARPPPALRLTRYCYIRVALRASLANTLFVISSSAREPKEKRRTLPLQFLVQLLGLVRVITFQTFAFVRIMPELLPEYILPLLLLENSAALGL